MNGEEVARARVALSNEIDKIASLVKALKFQEAEENLPKVDDLYRQLIDVLNPGNSVHERIKENIKIRMNILYRNVEHGLERRVAGKKEDGNVF